MTGNDRELGRRIATLREERGWSQRALAKMVQVDQAVLSRIESGKREVRAKELESIARALGVDVAELLPGQPSEAPRVQPSAGAAPEEKLDRPRRKALEQMARRHYDTAKYVESPEPEDIADWEEADALPRSPSERSHFSRLLSSRDALPSLGQAADEAASPDEERDLSAGLVQNLEEPAPSVQHLSRSSEPQRRVDLDRGEPRSPALPAPAHSVIADYLRLRAFRARQPGAESGPWRSVDSLGRRRQAGKPAGRRGAAVDWHEPRDRYARLWRHELEIGGEGPVPDLVALFEDAAIAEVVVARPPQDRPVAAALSVPLQGFWSESDFPRGPWDDETVSFLFVNALRPVTLQRFALAHVFAHLVLGHGDVLDEQIDWSRANPIEAEANDFAEEFLAPAAAVARWYDRHGDPRPSVEVLLDLGATFGITFWAALYRSRAAGRLNPKLFSVLNSELRERQWELLPEQSLRGGLRDTLSTLSEETPLPPAGSAGVGGVKPRLDRGQGREAKAQESKVLRVPSRLTKWTLDALRQGRLSFAEAARVLHLSPTQLSRQLERLGIE